MVKMQFVHILSLLAAVGSAKVVPQKRVDICGAKGYDRGEGNYDYNDSGDYSTLTACSERCSADTKCKSFGYGENVCMLFDIALSNNFDADSASPDIYYDRGCISSSPVPSTTAIPTTAAPTTTPPPTSAPSTTTPTTIPSTCTDTPPTVSITSFRWFNSTHNLDCAKPNYPPGSEVCFNSDSLCPARNATCACTPYCYTGLPAVAYTPLGYGPPDTITIGIDGVGVKQTCTAANPQSFRWFNIGGGHIDCGSAADIVGFVGDSTVDGAEGFVYYNNRITACDGKYPRYEARFPVGCERDAGGNATCTAQLPVTMDFVRFL
ncbi:hypothetical protein KVT40_000874 [Elsinoe batatas]|uniref:Apple domain-containing protein n=1 Tax=Elsinoe batatas TaxID=2601811 RepID=A0A8K0KRX7_9PEZI|nr:hypothetical protein KVT40_009277 [Elsinoe batatas]KAG8631734.1 hypothetical protein KVT40_000874 [Elsinoe batatas]